MDLVQESATFPSITMDKKVVADMLLLKLYSAVGIARALNMHSELRKLELYVEETEGNSRSGNQGAEMLKLAFYQAEHVIEAYEIFILRN